MASVANMRHQPALRAALDRADEHGDAMRTDRRTAAVTDPVSR